MRKICIGLLALALCGAAWVYAAQDTALDGMAEVRDPVRLKAWLDSNAADAETRLAAVEAGTAIAHTLETNTVVSAVTSTLETNTIVYLDASTNVVTNTFVYVSAVSVTSGSATNVQSIP